MSTLSSSLNSSAAALVNDFLVQGRNADDQSVRSMWLGRLTTLGFGLLQIAVAIGTDQFIGRGKTVDYVLAMQASLQA